ncbi:hypothetical protein KI387_026669, partial [Taxus chinensis]
MGAPGNGATGRTGQKRSISPKQQWAKRATYPHRPHREIVTKGPHQNRTSETKRPEILGSSRTEPTANQRCQCLGQMRDRKPISGGSE